MDGSERERKSEREREGACHQKGNLLRCVRPSEGQSRKVGQSRMAALQWHMQESECGGMKERGKGKGRSF